MTCLFNTVFWSTWFQCIYRLLVGKVHNFCALLLNIISTLALYSTSLCSKWAWYKLLVTCILVTSGKLVESSHLCIHAHNRCYSSNRFGGEKTSILGTCSNSHFKNQVSGIPWPICCPVMSICAVLPGWDFFTWWKCNRPFSHAFPAARHTLADDMCDYKCVLKV